MEPRTEFKITVIGDETVGKTSILQKCKLHMNDVETRTNDDIDYLFTIPIKDKNIQLKCWDTDCSEKYDEFRPLTYRDTDCFLICFAYDDKDSFIHAERKWLNEIRNNCAEPIIVFVMTKIELRNNDESITKDGKKVITKEMIDLMLNRVCVNNYWECSSEENIGVYSLFSKVAELLSNETQKKKKKRKLSTTDKIRSLFM
ncbi:Rho family GTPase [Entamoeba marina]